MRRLNRIIKRIIKKIAAHYDADGNVVNTISQQDCDNAFNNNNREALNVLNQMLGHYTCDVVSELEYKSTGIAPYGDSFVGKDGNNYIIEWHIYEITTSSGDNAYIELDYLYRENIITNGGEKEIRKELERQLQNQCFIGTVLIFQNRLYKQISTLDLSINLEANYFFKSGTDMATMKKFGKNLIEQIKQSLI